MVVSSNNCYSIIGRNIIIPYNRFNEALYLQYFKDKSEIS